MQFDFNYIKYLPVGATAKKTSRIIGFHVIAEILDWFFVCHAESATKCCIGRKVDKFNFYACIF